MKQYVLNTEAVSAMAHFFLFITLAAVITPFMPDMPDFGLGASWVMGMNQAMAQGLVIGRDIIFTFGPYSSLFTRGYIPSLDGVIILGGLFFSFFYYLQLRLLIDKLENLWLVAFALFTLLMYSPDAYFLSYPLLLSLAVSRFLSKQAHAQPCGLLKNPVLLIALSYMPLGLLPIIKVSFLPLCIFASVFSAALFLQGRLFVLLAASLLLPAVSCAAFWMLSGQPLSGLPDYFTTTVPIMSGYTEAMAVDGPVLHIVLYLASALLILALAVRPLLRLAPGVSLFAWSSIALFLFVAFKSSFVRHDEHAAIGTAALGISAFMLYQLRKETVAILAIVAVIACSGIIYATQGHLSKTGFPARMAKPYGDIGIGLIARSGIKPSLEDIHRERLAGMKKLVDIPVFPGTMDIYSYDQAYIMASGNTWNPRPVFQSYSAYTPALLEANAAHLTKPGAPDILIFKTQPIDNRFPALEEGMSLPLILANYEAIHEINGYAFMAKKDKPDVITRNRISASRHRLGETVDIPKRNNVFSSMVIEKTLLGKLWSIAFKPSPLVMTVTLENGEEKNFFMISGMTSTGFFLSPLIETTDDFLAIKPEIRAAANRPVKSIRISTTGFGSLLWHEQFSLTLEEMKFQGKSHPGMQH